MDKSVFKIIFFLGLLIIMLVSCTKQDEQPKEYLKSTYTNYHGYWNYCRFGSDEIDPELRFFKSEKVFLFEREFIKDTTYCKSFNCPRNGTMQYLTRITLE
jgi:hypothetical protein